MERRSCSGVRARDSRWAVGATRMGSVTGMWFGGRRLGAAFAFLMRRSFLVLVTFVRIWVSCRLAVVGWSLRWLSERMIALVRDMVGTVVVMLLCWRCVVLLFLRRRTDVIYQPDNRETNTMNLKWNTTVFRLYYIMYW